MIKILIIDDEKMSINNIRYYIRKYSKDFIIFSADNTEHAKEIIQKEKPHIIFLDIELKEMTGVEFISSFENLNCEIIFQTGHSDYAIPAYEIGASDYLLKPMQYKKIEKCLDRIVEKIIKNDRKLKSPRKLNNVEANILEVKQKNTTTIIKHSDIIYMHFEDSVTKIITKNEEIIVYKTLKKLQEEVPEQVFLQLSRTDICNINYIKEIKKEGLKTFAVIDTPNQESMIEVSKQNKIHLIEEKNKIINQK